MKERATGHRIRTVSTVARAVAGQRLVLASGVFDLLHPGHEAYLAYCAGLGDRLVVGLNTDASVLRVRGAPPRLPLPLREAALVALPQVDWVIPFDEDHPGRLIRALRPQVYVKGSDYEGLDVAERPDLEAVGARYVICPLPKTHSSRQLWALLGVGR